MSKMFRNGVLAGCAMLVLTSAAFAQEEEEKKKESWLPGGLAGNVAYATDYSFRGISQTQRDMAFSGGLDWNHDSGIHLGLWSSSIKFRTAAGVPENVDPDGDGSPNNPNGQAEIDKSYLEQDFYGGFTHSFDAFSFDILGVYYFYPMDDKYNYGEGILNLSYDFGITKLMLQGVGSNDYFGYASVGGYVNGGLNTPLPLDIPYFDVSLESRVGYTTTNQPIYFNAKNGKGEQDYVDQTIALIFALPFNMTLDFRYVGTNIKTSEYGNADAGDRFVFAAKYAF